MTSNSGLSSKRLSLLLQNVQIYISTDLFILKESHDYIAEMIF